MSRIVVGTDGSAHAERALRWAVHEAELRSAMVELVHGYVIHPHAVMMGRSDRDLAEALMDTVIERNRAMLDRVEWDATVVPLLASPTAALLDAGEDADLIVVGSRGLGGFGELFLGATSYHTAAHASTPVAVIRGGPDSEATDAARPIVVGVDDSRASRRALCWALDEAERRDVDLTLVHAYYAPAHPSLARSASPEQLGELRLAVRDRAADVIEDVLDDVDGAAKVEMKRVVRAGSPAGVLLASAGAEGMLVVGTHGRSALGRAVFGSVSHQCLHHATGPVIVVP